NTSTNDLTLQAGGNITSSGGPFTLQLNGGDFTAIFNDAGATNSGGAASFVANNLTIETSDGKIVIQQGNLNDQYQGTIFLQKECLLDARTGSIELTLHSNNNGEGIKLDSSNIVAGDVILNGIGSAGIDSNVSSIQANNSIHSIGIAKANDKPGINLVDSVFWVKNTGDIILNGQAADSSGLGISLLQSAINPQLASKILTENGSVTLNSIRGSIQLDNASIDCRGSGVLTVNSQQDCSLLGSLHPCVMEVGSGIADFTIGRDLTLSSTNIFTQVAIASNKENLTGGSLQFTVERNVSLLATDTSSLCLIGFSTVSNAANVAGDILFHHVGGDLILEGANNIGPGNFGFAQIGHISFLSLTEPVTLNGNISLLVDGSISLVGGSASETSYAQIGHGGLYPFITTGQVTAIAGKNIVMQSNTGSANIINKGGDVTLVTDNLFPVSPLIGPGFFAINSTVSASGELRIYTATRSQNQINDLINGSPFTPGTLFVDSNEEIWSTYYLGGGYGGGPFTIYYKEPPIVPPIVPPIEVIEETFQFALDQAELSTMLQNFYIVNPPIYQAKLDYFSQRELMCFDPYRRVLRYRVNQKNLTN
ncbi:MAG: hypothetical protein QG627_228, partial [Chlamydiota bacterium]|nr:hypothetical protein [Chlamydiota bacterium]